MDLKEISLDTRAAKLANTLEMAHAITDARRKRTAAFNETRQNELQQEPTEGELASAEYKTRVEHCNVVLGIARKKREHDLKSMLRVIIGGVCGNFDLILENQEVRALKFLSQYVALTHAFSNA